VTDKVKLRVGKVFFDDHEDRLCIQNSGEPEEYRLKRTKTTVTVQLSLVDAMDLLSDAIHYSDLGPETGMWDVCQSANNMVGSLMRQFRKMGLVNEGERAETFKDRMFKQIWAEEGQS
jgi:hypothetical protein